jgi:hypothetical protein
MGVVMGRGRALVLAVALGGLAVGEGPVGAQDPGEFLRGLAGEWSVESEARLGPGLDPVRSEARESARLIGGKWLVAEGSGVTPNGQPFTSILTLGPGSSGEGFVGTWIDSMQSHMWVYSGSLDAAGRVLTLETEGPVFGDPTRPARYREIIEVPDPHRKVMRSLILGPDGQWFEFARSEYRRTDGRGA